MVGVDWPALRKKMRERSAAIVKEARKTDIKPGIKMWKLVLGIPVDAKTLWE
jgi:hypothetical protein